SYVALPLFLGFPISLLCLKMPTGDWAATTPSVTVNKNVSIGFIGSGLIDACTPAGKLSTVVRRVNKNWMCGNETAACVVKTQMDQGFTNLAAKRSLPLNTNPKRYMPEG